MNGQIWNSFPNLFTANGQVAFRFWCQKVLPIVYDDSLSYYELLGKVVNYLNHTMDDVGKLGDAFESLVDFVNNYALEVKPEMIEEILEEHPEWTTTVQDNSLEWDKLKQGTLGWLTPQMFGAVGDGVADDTVAIQEGVNKSSKTGLPLTLVSNYLVTEQIMVPRGACISSIDGKKYNIYVDRDLWDVDDSTDPATLTPKPVFKCVSNLNHYRNFGVIGCEYYNEDGVTKPRVKFRHFIAFDYDPLSNPNTAIAGNSDSDFNNVDIGYCEIGIRVMGKNVGIRDCNFTHNKIGVLYDFMRNEDASLRWQLRGMSVIGCSFHGIGEEATPELFNGEACIVYRMHYIAYSEIIVKNCSANQSGRFILFENGSYNNFVIENNYCECWEHAIITIHPTVDLGGYGPARHGALMIVGNYLTGNKSQVSISPSFYGQPPENVIDLVNCDSYMISGNVIKMSQGESIKCWGGTGIICGNFFGYSGIVATTGQTITEIDTEKNYAIQARNSRITFNTNINHKDISEGGVNTSVMKMAKNYATNIPTVIRHVGNTGFDIEGQTGGIVFNPVTTYGPYSNDELITNVPLWSFGGYVRVKVGSFDYDVPINADSIRFYNGVCWVSDTQFVAVTCNPGTTSNRRFHIYIYTLSNGAWSVTPYTDTFTLRIN